MMGRKIALWLLWAGFVTYILLLAPPIEQDGQKLAQLAQELATGARAGLNPIILVLFNLVGIVLLTYSCLLFIDGRMQRVPVWPFVVASVATGVIGLLPYLALRETNQEFFGPKDILLNILDSRWAGMILSLSTVGLLIYGLAAGDWGDFVYQFQTSRFVHGMSLAFCLLCLLFPTLLGDDMARRKLNKPQVFWLVSLVPLLGPLAYLCLRPPLPESTTALS